jgi:glycosyltransferase involved in cell wall biosynthesis
MRVLLASPAYAPSVGGVETCVREVSTRLRAEGVDAHVLTSDESGKLARRELVGGVPVTRMRAWPRDSDFRLAPGIYPFVATSDCDLVHVQCYQGFVAPAAMAGARAAEVPYVLTFHGGGHSARWRNKIRSAQLWTLRPLIKHAERLVATAEWEIEAYSSLLRLSPSRFTLIPNGSTLPKVAAPAQPEGHLFVSIGRAERYKGHHHVIRALPHVLRELPDARLWVAGEGPYERALWKQVDALGLRDRVEIYADRDRERYATRLAGASAALLCSEFETHPMGALEAAGLGVPLLVADNRGLSELADKGLADAVEEVRRPELLAARMLAAAAAPHRPALENIPTWERCAELHWGLYDEVALARGVGG